MVTVRQQFTEELEQLRLQVELMAVRVDQNLERMREVLRTGDSDLARQAITADNEIDAMNVSLMERCYDLLRREAPVASDLRFIVSVLRVLGELERIGDLSLRVDKVADEHELLSMHPSVFDVLLVDGRRGPRPLPARPCGPGPRWTSALATELASSGAALDLFQNRLTAELVRLEGPEAAHVAMVASGDRPRHRPHRRPRRHHRRPAPLPDHRRSRPPGRRGPVTAARPSPS